MELEWKNIDIEVKNKNTRYNRKRIKLVSNACGRTSAGLFAIMGPSGSGKTTFLKALSGRIAEGSRTSGVVKLNGEERDYMQWRSDTGYVDQDDEIFDELTARESITYAAQFRLKHGRENIAENIEEIAKKMKITHVLDAKMANVSGGERKRIMLAIELVSDPKIIFLDEPTSGLDNFTTLSIIQLLKSLADEGKIIVFTIHQPDDETIQYFDSIMLLSQGRTVYLGEMSSCQEYLINKGFETKKQDCFSNFAMRILSVDPGVYHETENNKQLDSLVEDVKSKYGYNEEEKNHAKQNEEASNFTFNMRHTMLLLKRRFHLQLFQRRNIISFVFLCIFTLLIWFIMFHSYATIKSSFDRQMSKPLDARTDPLLAFVASIEDKDKRNKIFVQLTQLYVYMEAVPLGTFIICFSGLTTGVAFQTEIFKIRREMGVASYSVTSYYVSVLIFELIKSSPILVVIPIMLYYGFVQSKIRYVSLTLLLYVCSIILYLLAGSLSPNMKKVMFFSVVCLMFNSISLDSLVLALKAYTLPTGSEILLLVCNLFPQYIIGPMLSVVTKYDYIDAMKSIYKQTHEKAADLAPQLIFDKQISMVESVCLGFRIPYWANLIVLAVWLSFVLSYSLINLSSILLPEVRMRLNKRMKK